MRLLQIFPILCLLCPMTLVANPEKMPLSAQVLKNKLEEWEHKKKKEFEAEVSKKRKEVISALETIQDETTKKGDLEGAISIKEYIDSLGINNSTNSDQEQWRSVYGRKFSWESGGDDQGNKLILSEDGNGSIGDNPIKWNQGEGRIFVIDLLNGGISKLEWSEDFSSFKGIEIRKGGKKYTITGTLSK